MDRYPHILLGIGIQTRQPRVIITGNHPASHIHPAKMYHSRIMFFALSVTRVTATNGMWNCTSSMGGCTADTGCCSPDSDLRCCSDEECHGTTPRGRIVQGACMGGWITIAIGVRLLCGIDVLLTDAQLMSDDDCLYNEACRRGGGDAFFALGCYPSNCKIDADCTSGPSGKCMVFGSEGFRDCAGPSARACAYSNSSCGEAPCPDGGVCYWNAKPAC
jgi:hypothetical protein